MVHDPYTRVVPDSDTAVLMIHGIMGTPRHFDMLLPLVSMEWSIYNILLDGHGGTAKDFGHTSMSAWKAQVEEIFSELCRKYHRVILVGHSMGTLFSIRLAAKHPDKVPFLFLLAVPLSVHFHLRMAENALRVAFNRVRLDDPWQAATQNACSVGTTWQLWEYVGWIPRFLELFREIGYVRKLLQDLSVPCHALQSRMDEMVSVRSVKILKENQAIKVTVLPDSGHYYYSERDAGLLGRSFQDMCNELMKTHDA